MELFTTMRSQYYDAARNLWHWQRRLPFLLRLVTWPWPLAAEFVLGLIALSFGLLTIFDSLSLWLRGQRAGVILNLHQATQSLAWHKSAYFSAPLVGALMVPMGLLFGLFPKFSTDVAESEGRDKWEINHGFFFQLAQAYARLAWQLLRCCFSHGVWFAPIALTVACCTAPIAAWIALLFLAFILLDFLGFIVDFIRLGVVRSSRALADHAGTNVLTVVIFPVLLVLLFPVYLLLLLIPKLSSYDPGS